MKLRLFFLSFLAFACLHTTAQAQTNTDPNEGSQLSQNPTTGAYTFSWWGRSGRTYFLEQSDDLLTWTYLPVIESGSDQVIQWNFTSSAPQFFIRLEYTDIPTADPFNDDFDDDGVSNYDELLQDTDPLSANLDTNGLPLGWEKFYGIPFGTDPNALAARGDGITYLQAFQQGLNPNDYYNGRLPNLTILSGTPQTGLPGALAPQALIVQVMDVNGAPLLNAPIQFQTDVGQLLASNNASPTNMLVLRTDENGQAKAFFQLPNSQNTICTVTALATSNGQSSPPATFTITSDDGTGSYVSPFAPTNFVSQGNPDGTVDMTWTNNTDDQTPVEIEMQQVDGSWKLVATLEPGTNSYHYISGQ